MHQSLAWSSHVKTEVVGHKENKNRQMRGQRQAPVRIDIAMHIAVHEIPDGGGVVVVASLWRHQKTREA